MAYWKIKHLKKGTYYYIYESYYEDGKSKQRMLEYIGTLNDVLAMAMDSYNAKVKSENSGQAPPDNEGPPSFDADEFEIKSYAHGDSMAMYYGAKLIGIQEILDECFPPKCVKGLSRSEVLILAMIHRAVDPGSKRQFANWANQTSLPYYLGFQASDLDSQAFWEAMDGITDEMIETAWNKIVMKIQTLFGVELKILHLDYTNYFTFIDTQNGRCEICKRGHNKQKRDDLLQFSLAVVTASDLQIPIVWDMYEGNKNDKSEFADFVKKVEETSIEMGYDPSQITIVFDGGSNSEANFAEIKFHIVCPDSLHSHKEYLDISLNKYEEITLSNGKKRKAYRIDNVEFCGVKGTGVLTLSEALKEGQVAELNRDLKKLDEAVEEENSRLKNPRSRIFTQMRKREAAVARDAKDAREYNDDLQKELKQQEAEGKKSKGKPKKPKAIPVWDYDAELLTIVEKNVLHKQYLAEFVEINLVNNDGIYSVVVEIDQQKKDAYITKNFGKKLTCTDHTEWSTLQILDCYGDQECIEGMFRVSKDVHHFAVRPQYHYRDPKIHVHVFCCLTAIAIAETLRKKCEEQGIDLTKANMLDKLHLVRDAWVSYKGKKIVRKLEKIEDEELLKLWKLMEDIGKSTMSSSEEKEAK